MSDFLNKIAESNDRIVELQKVRVEAEASALAHEQAAREDRMRQSAAKLEAADLQKVVGSARVLTAVELAAMTASQATKQAEKARSDAEAVLARLVEKEKQIDDWLAEHRNVEYDVSRMSSTTFRGTDS